MAKRIKSRDTLEILYEDNHLIAINKPGGWLVQGDETGDETIADYVKLYIKDRYNKPGDVFLGTIHRIDRPVSGTVIFARTSKALSRMNELFRKREVEKTYWAIVTPRPQAIEGHLSHYISKNKETNIAKAYNQEKKGGKLATLKYQLLAEIGDLNLLEVKPHTGRPHQIRVQLAKIGSPIWGDIKYGSTKKAHTYTIFLHSKTLSFIHPIKKERVTIHSPLPDRQIWREFHHIDPEWQ